MGVTGWCHDSTSPLHGPHEGPARSCDRQELTQDHSPPCHVLCLGYKPRQGKHTSMTSLTAQPLPVRGSACGHPKPDQSPRMTSLLLWQLIFPSCDRHLRLKDATRHLATQAAEQRERRRCWHSSSWMEAARSALPGSPPCPSALCRCQEGHAEEDGRAQEDCTPEQPPPHPRRQSLRFHKVLPSLRGRGQPGKG